MSSDSSDTDSESSCEWTLVSPEGEELEDLELETIAQYVRAGCADISSEPSTDAEQREIGRIHELVPSINDEDAVDDTDLEVAAVNLVSVFRTESASSSDIEKIIDENDTFNTIHSSQSSNFSFLESNQAEADSLEGTDSLSVISEDQTDLSSLAHDVGIPENLREERICIYKHVPNQRINVVLNFLLVFSVATVVGLGVGHFIGWSNQWDHQRAIQRYQIWKLKNLNEEVDLCCQKDHQWHLGEYVGGLNSKPCFEKVDYWKGQFDRIVDENKSDACGGDRCEAVAVAADQKLAEEFRRLTMLLEVQLKHLQALKNFVEVKQDEVASFQKMSALEENRELKAKLVEEEEEDLRDEQDMHKLLKENAELHMELNRLRKELEDEEDTSEEEDNIINVEVGTLRQQNNLLEMENDDLRQVIARLRYGRPPNGMISAHQQMQQLNQLATENTDLKLEIGKMRYGKPPARSVDSSGGGDGGNLIPEDDATEDDADVEALRKELEKLQQAVDFEKNQTVKWKQLYESLKSNSSSNEFTFASWLLKIQSSNLSDFLDLLKLGGVSVRESLNELLSTAEKTALNETWHKQLWLKIHNMSSMTLLNLKQNLQQKWDELNNVTQATDANKGVLKKMNKLLKNALDKFQDFGKQLQHPDSDPDGKDEKMVSKFMKRVTNFVNGIETKWDKLKSDLALKQIGKLLKTGSYREGNENDVQGKTGRRLTENEAAAVKLQKVAKPRHELDRNYNINHVPKHHKFLSKNYNLKDEDAKMMQRESDYGDSLTKQNPGASRFKEPKNGKPKDNIGYKHSRSLNDNIGKEGNVQRKTKKPVPIVLNKNYKGDEDSDCERDSSKTHKDGASNLGKKQWRRSNDNNGKLTGNKDQKQNGDWFFRRAKYRDDQKRKAREAEWVFDRARDRESQHQVHRSEFYRDWYLRRVKARDTNRKRGLWRFEEHDIDNESEDDNFDDESDSDSEFDDDFEHDLPASPGCPASKYLKNDRNANSMKYQHNWS